MVISSSSPLIYLAALDDFDLLRTLFDEVTIPPAVFDEVVVGGAEFPVARSVIAAQGKWIQVRNLGDASKAEALGLSGLDRGESEALVLAQELRRSPYCWTIRVLSVRLRRSV